MSSDPSYYSDADNSYGEQSFSRRSRPSEEQRSRPTLGRRRGKAPQSVNGIHRRRRRKMNW